MSSSHAAQFPQSKPMQQQPKTKPMGASFLRVKVRPKKNGVPPSTNGTPGTNNYFNLHAEAIGNIGAQNDLTRQEPSERVSKQQDELITEPSSKQSQHLVEQPSHQQQQQQPQQQQAQQKKLTGEFYLPERPISQANLAAALDLLPVLPRPSEAPFVFSDTPPHSKSENHSQEHPQLDQPKPVSEPASEPKVNTSTPNNCSPVSSQKPVNGDTLPRGNTPPVPGGAPTTSVPASTTNTALYTSKQGLSSLMDANTPRKPRYNEKFYTTVSVAPENPFTWDKYLNMMPAEVAPKEAFMQSPTTNITNKFKRGMKLVAKDPRNASAWCLATVLCVEGLRLRLRFDGSDSMNDLFELVDSENISAVELLKHVLYPPMAYQGNLATYPKFVEKQLIRPDTICAPRDYFVVPPQKPGKNLFKPGMKLEAIDRKNRYLICPASVGKVQGDDIEINFDGWRGSMDYTCKYYSRDIFPVNWCRDTGHSISAPSGWDNLVANGPTASQQPKKQSEPVLNRTQSSKNKSPVKTSRSPRKKIRNQTSTPKKRPHPSTVKPNKESKIQKDNGSQARKESILKTPKDETPVTAPIDQLSPEIASNSSKQPRVEETPSPQSDRSPSDLISSSAFDQLTEDLSNDRTKEEPITSPYQCQRTVPYDEWRKTKQGDQPHKGSVSTTVLSRDASYGESEEAANNSFSTLSIDGSASPLSQGPVGAGRRKKMKFDPSFHQPTSSEVPERTSTGESIPPSNDTSATDPNFSNASLPSGSYSNWTVQDVLNVIAQDETLAKYSSVFETHEIDGKAFALLTTEVMINHMGLKIGPVLKINDLIEKVKRFSSP